MNAFLGSINFTSDITYKLVKIPKRDPETGEIL